MISIPPHQVTPAIMQFFDITRPTMPGAFNVLESVTRGHILVNDLDTPTWAAVRENAFTTLYLGGQVDRARLESPVAYFRPMGDVGLGCWLDSELNVLNGYSPNSQSVTGHPLPGTD